MQDWHKVIELLLHHFDCNEGTTYLYAQSVRDDFVQECPIAVQAEVKAVLDAYHTKAR